MDIIEGSASKWSTIRDKFSGFIGKVSRSEQSGGAALDSVPDSLPNASDRCKPLTKAGNVIRDIGLWLFRLRKVFMAIPVVWLSLRLASYNLENLPEQVGLNLQANGTYAQIIDRNLAIYGPLGITAACLLLMFCSRKARYPWIISLFTLVLPIVILLTNLYPQ